MTLQTVLEGQKGKIDLYLFVVAIVLTIFGLAVLYSATFYRYNDAYVIKELMRLLVGVFVLVFVGLALPSGEWKNFAISFMALSILLLVIVAFSGKRIHGAKRWLAFGSFRFQPSEFTKLAVIVYISYFIDKHRDDIKKFRVFIVPVIVVFLNVLLVAIQPNLSTALLILFLSVLMLFIGGARLSHIIFVGLLSGLLAASAIFAFPHAKKRMSHFTGIFAGKKVEKAPMSFQVKQSIISISTGGLVGKGPGRGRGKLSYVPFIENDFIFSAIAEEFGFLGAILVFIAYFVLMWRGIKISIDLGFYPFKYLMAAGITILVIEEALFHISVCIGVVPPTGITLPFVSYGGTSLMFMMLYLGMLLKLSSEREQESVWEKY